MKQLYPFLSMLLLCLCQNGYSQSATAQENATQQTAEQVALGLFKAFNAHQWEQMAAFYAPDALLEDPAFPAPMVGTDGMVERYTALQQQYPNIQDKLTHVYVSGNTVVVEFIASGTAVDGSHQLSLPVVCVLSIRNGKIVRDATYYDLHP